MIINYLYYALLTTLAAVSSYYLTESTILLIAVLSIFIIYFTLYEILLRRKTRQLVSHQRDLNIFIHDTLCSFFVTRDLNEAINLNHKRVSDELQEEINMLDEYKGINKIDHLSNYFNNSSLYLLFKKTINLMVKSTNPIEDASFLLNENNRYINLREQINKNSRLTYYKFTILWIITFIIAMLARLIFANYSNILNSSFFLIGVSLFIASFLISIILINYVNDRSYKIYEN